MKKFNILFLCFIAIFPNCVIAFNGAKIENTLKDKYTDVKKPRKHSPKNILFNFKDEDLIDIINIVAGIFGENIILPTGNDVIKSKVTIDIPKKLSKNEAWDLLNTVLDLSGYVISLGADGMRQIKKKDQNTARGPFRIFKEDAQERVFVGDYENIPEIGDERITFIGYFDNIQVPKEAGAEGGNVIQQVIQMFTGTSVTSSSEGGTSAFRFLPDSNGVIIVDKASNIRSMMKIFKELDKAEFKEHFEIIKLEHVTSDKVEKMFNEDQTGILGKKQKTTYRLGKKRKTQSKYFDKETKVVADQKSNSIMLLGRKESIDRIKEFIFRFIDVPIEGGRSVLHRKKLDYLSADNIRETLLKVIGNSSDSSVQARSGAAAAGPERFFTEGIKIETDRPKQSESSGEAATGQYKYSGTNSLLIAANNEDWLKISDLIEKLDKPIQQAIIEILVVDLEMDGNKILGTQSRNPALAPLFNISQNGRPIDAQSAQLAAVQTTACPDGCVSNSATLHADLMQGTQITDSTLSTYNPFIGGATAGSTLFTLSDKNGSTWSVLKLLDLYQNTKILSHPYIIARNNKAALVKVGTQRLLKADVSGSTSGTSRVEIRGVDADLVVNVLPRIGGIASDGSRVVNMQVDIDVNEFKTVSPVVDQTGPNPRIIRKIVTNANIKSGEILVLGGLIKNETNDGDYRVPVLGSIPLIGWLFKTRSSVAVRNNLTVFIRVTAVEPELLNKMDYYTKDYIQAARRCSSEGGLFEGLRDPITRWFFGSQLPSDEYIDKFEKIEEKVVSTEEIEIKASSLNGQNINPKGSKDNQKIAAAPLVVTENKKPENNINDTGVNIAAAPVLNEKTSFTVASATESKNSKEYKNIESTLAAPASQVVCKEPEILIASCDKTCKKTSSEKGSCEKSFNEDKLKEMLKGVENPFC